MKALFFIIFFLQIYKAFLCPLSFRKLIPDGQEIMVQRNFSGRELNISVYRVVCFSFLSERPLLLVYRFAVVLPLSQFHLRGFHFRSVCMGNCKRKLAEVTVEVENYSYKNASNFKIDYIMENCQRLFWGNWVEKVSCFRSKMSIYMRQCFGCYNTIVNITFCRGSFRKYRQCRPSWGVWIAGDCSATNCNETGKRMRRRKCLYGDGTKSIDSRSCSEEPEVYAEKCFVNNTNCFYDENRGRRFEDKIGVYVGSGIGALLIGACFRVLLHFFFKKSCTTILPLKNKNENRLKIKTKSFIERTNIDAVVDELRNKTQHEPVNANYSENKAQFNNKSFFHKNQEKKNNYRPFVVITTANKTPKDIDRVSKF